MEQNRQLWQKREEWIDPVKGLVILWMVLYQASVRVGYGGAHDGWLFWAAEFGRPIRMPFLFLVSGMLVASSFKLSWKEFLNKRVLHLIYFFILWTIFQILIRDVARGLPLSELPLLFLRSLTLDPPASLWFILALPLFLIVMRACRDINPFVMLSIGLVLELLHIGPFTVITDNSSRYFIYFLFGIYGVMQIKSIAAFFEDKISLALIFFLASLALCCSLVYGGLWAWRGIGVILSCLMLIAFIALGTLLVKTPVNAFLSFLGRNTIIFYLGYTPFMIIVYSALKNTVIGANANLFGLAMWLISLIGAYILWQVAIRVKVNFLFERPAWLKI